MFHPYVPRPQSAVGNMNMGRASSRPCEPVMAPLGVHYHCDGTGRDTYIS